MNAQSDNQEISAFLPYYDHPFLESLEKIIEANIKNEQFGVEDLAREISLSRFQIYRRLHALTGQSISQFIREIRLKQAMILLLKGLETASEIAYQVGFSSPAYFSKCFTEYYGITPGEVKRNDVKAIKNKINSRSNKSGRISKSKSNKYTFQNTRHKFFHFIRKKSIRGILIILGFVTILLITYLLPQITSTTGNNLLIKFASLNKKTTEKSIAVLSFRIPGGEEIDEHIAFGVAEAIRSQLSGILSLRVSSLSTQQYFDSGKTIPEIGRELKVSYVLHGSVQKFEDIYRITPRIDDVNNDQSLWSKQYDIPTKDIWNRMNEIALDIVTALKTSITSEEKSFIATNASINSVAYDLYIRGMMYHDRFISTFEFNEQDLNKAEKLFRESISVDSSFALAYAGLGAIAQRRRFLNQFSPVADSYNDSILYFARKALDINPDQGEAYYLRGEYYKQLGQWEKAIEDQKKSAILNPNSSDPYHSLGEIWIHRNDPFKAYKNLKNALSLERNGPQKTNILYWLARLFSSIGDYEAAIGYINENIRLQPDESGVYANLSWVYCEMGQFDKALETMRRICKNKENSDHCDFWFFMVHAFKREYSEAMKYVHWDPASGELGEPNLGYILLKTGRIEEGKKMLTDLLNDRIENWSSHYNHWRLAEVYAGLGENNKAIEELKMLERENPYDGMFSFLPHYHLFENIKNDPEVIEILDRVNARKVEARKKMDKIKKEAI